MLLDEKPYTFDRLVRIAISCGLLVGVIWLLGILSSVLVPFAIALILAYMINPLVALIEKRVKNHTASVFLGLLTVLVVIGAIVYLVVPVVLSEISRLGKLLLDLFGNSELAQRASQRLPANMWQHITQYVQQEDLQRFFAPANILKLGDAVMRKMLPGVWGVLAGAASFVLGLFGLFVVALYLVFMLLDFKKVTTGWKQLIPDVYREPVVGFVEEFNSAMNRYFRAQAAVAFTVGIMFAAGFSIIGLPLGVLLGLFIGLLNMVPYLQIIGLVPAFCLALVHALDTGGSFWIMFGLTGLVFIVVQIIQDVILVPRLMGKATGLSPIVILLSLSIWGQLLGFLGLVIALPMTCLCWAYYKRLFKKSR